MGDVKRQVLTLCISSKADTNEAVMKREDGSSKGEWSNEDRGQARVVFSKMAAYV